MSESIPEENKETKAKRKQEPRKKTKQAQIKFNVDGNQEEHKESNLPATKQTKKQTKQKTILSSDREAKAKVTEIKNQESDPVTKMQLVDSKISELDKQIYSLLSERQKFIECKNELATQIKPVIPKMSEACFYNSNELEAERVQSI